MSAKKLFVTAIMLVGACALVAGCGSDTVSPTSSTEAPILPPQNIVVTQMATGVLVTWDANTQTNLAGYKVYRLDVAQQNIQTLTANPISANSFKDVSATQGLSYDYHVTSVSSKGTESNFVPVSIVLQVFGTDNKHERRNRP